MPESLMTSQNPHAAALPFGVDGLNPVTSLDDCGLGALNIPAGWEAGQVDSPIPLPILRMALFRNPGDTVWTACETLTAFRATGHPPPEPAAQRCENTLRGLAAASVSTTALNGSARQTIGARSNGYFTVAGRRLWIQCSTYLQPPEVSVPGLLIEQILLVDAESRARLRDDIDQLTDDVHAAVVDTFDTVTTGRSPEEGNPDGS